MRWVSIDPGQVHVGVAAWEDGALMRAWETTPEGLMEFIMLDTTHGRLKLVVIESFTLASPRYHRQKATSAAKTLELIGMVKGVCLDRRVEVVEQQPSVRHVAMKSRWWAELEKPTNNHAASAIAHGMYYLRFNKKCRVAATA